MKEFLEKLNAIHQQHALAANYAKTLALLQALKAGEIAVDNVVLTGDGWNVIEVPAAGEAASVKLAEPPAE
jgi:hypothetical protein